MSVLLDASTRVVVQGITGRQGAFHAQRMAEAGTAVVAGVTPGRAGAAVDGLPDVPVFNTMAEAVADTGANVACIFVPPPFAADAILEDISAGLELIVCITEGIPVIDMLRVMPVLRARRPASSGPIARASRYPAAQVKVGIMPWEIHAPGRVGVVSRSGTLTYEVVQHLTDGGLGQSAAVGIGGDPIIGTRFTDVLELYEQDAETDGIVLLGEIGGGDEEQAAAIHPRARDQAGQRLHRRQDRPAGASHGARGRYRVRIGRNGRGQRGRPSGSRSPAWATPRGRRSICWPRSFR